jgi:hypothetical protein
LTVTTGRTLAMRGRQPSADELVNMFARWRPRHDAGLCLPQGGWKRSFLPCSETRQFDKMVCQSAFVAELNKPAGAKRLDDMMGFAARNAAHVSRPSTFVPLP